MKITIAGATGFVGRNLINRLKGKYQLQGLSRRHITLDSQIEWTQTDLFSFTSISQTLKGTQTAIYLVHSMLPNSRLFQGSFADTDLFLADNFARACLKNNVKHIIYLGGVTPKKNESKHLSSRLEVEEVFRATGIPTTVLRAGMIVGDHGSSFEILKNLVHNLPLMVLPNWTKNPTQTIFINDLINVIENVISNNNLQNKTINVLNGEAINYRKLIEYASRHYNKRKILIPVPINYISFSKLWVKIFGQADYELVSPLVDSLICDLSYNQIPLEIENLIKYRTFKSMLEKLIPEKQVTKRKRKKDKSNSVRSIQRISGESDLLVNDVANHYVRWLPKHFKNIVQVKSISDRLIFSLLFLPFPLLVLEKQEEKSEMDRIKFHIVGGILSKTKDTGWLEFRKILGDKFILVSINNFIPSLPWYVYKYTQALAHLMVMGRFKKDLSKFGITHKHHCQNPLGE